MESYIFLSVLDEKDTIVAWYGKRLVTAVGKITKGM